jgi:hypothetical protein
MPVIPASRWPESLLVNRIASVKAAPVSSVIPANGLPG